ncbi:ABC transporter permease [Ilumatobacter sp.]|uniref:ABC transporter permease n=1 Tax=Ilumatobacter sp. TaxID=1967498 RepID=UPI003B528020
MSTTEPRSSDTHADASHRQTSGPTEPRTDGVIGIDQAEIEADLVVPDEKSESPGQRFRRRLLANRWALIALVYLVLLVGVAIFAPWLAPKDLSDQDLSNVLAPPLDNGLLGTDGLGRDVLSRMIFATRVALLAVFQAVLVGLILGVTPGLVAGFFGGWVDSIIMRFTDAIMSFPPLILALAIVGVLGANLRNAMIAVGVIFAPTFLRLVRGSVLSVREETYIEASRSIGTPSWRIILRHILPNVMPPLLVQIALTSGFAMLAEASLSFLGLGVQPPDASWGTMLDEGRRRLSEQPWLVVWPGITLGVTVLAFNVLGDGIRDSLGREIRKE